MLEIKGKINTAICYASVIEEEAIEQIRRMCDYEFTAGSRIRIMPDVHAGKGCTIVTSDAECTQSAWAKQILTLRDWMKWLTSFLQG